MSFRQYLSVGFDRPLYAESWFHLVVKPVECAQGNIVDIWVTRNRKKPRGRASAVGGSKKSDVVFREFDANLFLELPDLSGLSASAARRVEFDGFRMEFGVARRDFFAN